MDIWLNILMKETCADRVGPRSVSLLCLRSKTKGHNWATVLFRVSIGDNFYLPVKGRRLWGQRSKWKTADRFTALIHVGT